MRDALTALPEPDQVRLGVTEDWKTGPHQLTYRQTERTFGLVAGALAKDAPDGLPSQILAAICDDLLEASIPGTQGGQQRAGGGLDRRGDLLPAAAARQPRLRRPRGLLGAPLRRRPRPGQRAVLRLLPLGRHHDARRARPARARAGPADDRLLLRCRPGPRPGPGADRDARARHPARRHPGRLRLRPPRRRGLGHPAPRRRGPADPGPAPLDRGPRGTHDGAIIANGNLYCPATPRPLLELIPLARDATPDQAAAHDQQTAETTRYKLGRITSDDADGYHRVMCPAAMGKIRCPLRPDSMTLDRNRPEILTPPGHPPACCTQQTITVPPDVAAKTRQKHDYPSKPHRRSYARRTGAERTFSTTKDPASNNIARGWTRLMGLAPLMLCLACLLAVRNQRILTAWDARQADDARRAAADLPPKPRRRRRKTRASLAATAAPP